MACAVSIETSVNIEDEHLLRLFLLIKKVGTEVCSKIFYNYFPEDKKQLYQTILSYKKILKPLLFPDQYELLYENKSEEIDASSFDITLFLLLLRKCCTTLPPPKKGWNKKPSITDLSESANLERLRRKRNSLAHTGCVALTTTLFEKKWRSCSNLLISLGADLQEINNYATMQLDLTNKIYMKEEMSILHDKLFQHIDVSFVNYTKNEEKIKRLQDEIDSLQAAHKSTISRQKSSTSEEQLVSRLKLLYSRTENIISCMEWDKQRNGYFKLEKIFVNPELYCWDQRKSLCGTEPLDFYDIIYQSMDRVKLEPINICILSDPGKGKSVLLQKISFDYSQNLQIFYKSFPSIEFVIFIRCRELLKYECMDDYIAARISKDMSSAKKNMFLFLLQSASEKVLFLIDGYDEIQHCTENHFYITNELESILSGSSYHGASIVATTRPSGLNTLPKQLTLFKEKYTISPFTTEQIKEYLAKYFSEKQESYWEKLYREIMSNEALQELTSSPLALSIICNLHEHSDTVPTNMTNLYHELILQMIQQFKANYGFNKQKVKRRMSEYLLNSIGQIALNSLHGGHSFFEQKDLVNHFNKEEKRKTFFCKNTSSHFSRAVNSTTILQLGFLRADSGTNPRQLNWYYEFEPKMCQKYVAAEFIINMLLKYGIDRGLKKAFPKPTVTSSGCSNDDVRPYDILKHDHELCLFVVDGFGRRDEKDLCKKLFNELFQEFGSIRI